MKKQNIILIGGGGHCKACIDVIEGTEMYDIKGIIDTPEKQGQKILGYSVIGNDNDIKEYISEVNNFLITVGFIKNPTIRIKLFEKVLSHGGRLPYIVSNKAHFSHNAQIDEGSIVMHGAVVNADAEIGKNCIVNNLSLVEHDAQIGNHTHISTGARVNGNCKIGERCFIGSGAIVNEGVEITNDVIVASGSLVRKDIVSPGVYAGNPLSKIR